MNTDIQEQSQPLASESSAMNELPSAGVPMVSNEELLIHYPLDHNVYKGTWRRCTPVAIKVCRAVSDGKNRALADAQLKAEIDKLSSLRHPRLISLLGVCVDLVEIRGEEIISGCGAALVLEFLEKGSLRIILERENALLSMLQKLTIAVDVCEGMRFLHESNVSHGDLTSETVLVDREGRTKLTGFGGGGLNRDGTAATALSVLSVSEQQADIASFGVLLWQLITGKVVSGGGANKASIKKKLVLLTEQERSSCPQALVTCMNQCLDGNSGTKRLIFAELYGPLQALLAEQSKRFHDRTKSVPDGFLCPITQDVMKDPVMLVDGHSYERKAIVDWLKRSNRSPLTNEVLADRTTMIDNYALKSAIASFLM